MSRDGRTHFVVERRLYFFDQWEDGIAELVRAERHDDVRWVRSLEAVYWWPEHEGKEWPALVVPAPEWGGVGPKPNAWAHFEEVIGMDDRYRWEPLAGTDDIS